jgi:hypothetical protein
MRMRFCAAVAACVALGTGSTHAGYVPTFSDKFTDLSNWQLSVEGGSDTGNNELEVRGGLTSRERRHTVGARSGFVWIIGCLTMASCNVGDHFGEWGLLS